MIDDQQGGLIPPHDGDELMAPPSADALALRRYAMDLLARREHSRLELEEKLRRHCGRAQAAHRADAPNPDAEIEADADARPSNTEALIQRTLDQLEQDGLQSDARYAEVLIRSRVNRGQGPLRIRADLRQRGLDAAAVDVLIEGYEDAWPELAAQVISKRFGEESAGDRREWARRARFLASRGFPEGLVARVLGPLP